MSKVALLGLFFLLPLAARGAATESDAERLAEGLPNGFGRPEIAIYPLVDQRPLALSDHDGPSTGATDTPNAWKLLLERLSSTSNLHVYSPEETRDRIQRRSLYADRLKLARERANEGYEDHREVRLARAITKLGAAVSLFRELEHHIIAPREVARAALTRGLAQQESGANVDAAESFRLALLLDPTVRLRAGYDRPEAIAALESARMRLVEGGVPAPEALDEGGTPNQAAEITIRGRLFYPHDRSSPLLVPGGGDLRTPVLELRIHTAQGHSIESEPLSEGEGSADRGDRLASRVWACLPFGRPPKQTRHRNQLYLDGGFTYFTFLSAPGDGLFGNFGAGAHVSYNFASNISFDAQFSLTNSNRDRSMDVRQDIVTARLSTGPGFTIGWGRVRFFGNIGFEVASPGEVITTTNPDCKFFDANTAPATSQCEPGDIDRVDRSLLIGAALMTGVNLRLVDRVYVAARVNFAEYFFELDNPDLNRPFGGDAALGYHF